MQHPAQRLSLILVRRMTNQQWIKTICAEGSGLSIDRTSGAPGRWSAYQKLPNSWSKAIPLFSIALASLFRSSLVARAPCRVGHFALSELNIVVIYDLDRLPHVCHGNRESRHLMSWRQPLLRARRATSLS